MNRGKSLRLYFLSLLILTALANRFLLLGINTASAGPSDSRAEPRAFILETTSGLRLHLSARSFQPGEFVFVKMEAIPGVDRAWIDFDHRKIALSRDNSSEKGGVFAFLGIDGDLEPGQYPLRLILLHKDRTWETAVFSLEVEAKAFRERKLKVAREFIHPPAAVRERIEREAELLRVVFSIMTPQWQGDGSFIFPHSGRITARFGDRRIYNDESRSFHNGVDIAASSGEPIRASNSGRIVVAGDFYFSGRMVVIDHGLGLFTSYAHLSRILVRRGQIVKKGEVIGLAGSTGLSTGSHLHWSVRVAGSRIDPTSLLEFSFPSRK